MKLPKWAPHSALLLTLSPMLAPPAHAALPGLPFKSPVPGVCKGSMCFNDQAAEKEFEKANNCRFPPPVPSTCLSALKVAGQNVSALTRARAGMSLIQTAATANGISAALLAAIGVRETGFLNIAQVGGGKGAGVFQIDLGANPSVTSAQAFDISYAANFAAGMLAANMSSLAKDYPKLTTAQLLQATAASYNFGTGNISGNPATIDVGTTGNNYGSNVVKLMSCFQ